MARHDALTDLPNRMLFRDRLKEAIRCAREGGPGFALALLDIDGFKGVNDRHGHPAGDALLQAIAARLRLNLRADDTVARLGGDEFALIAGNLEDVPVLMKRCHELGASLAEPYPLASAQGDFVAHVSASIGIAPWSAQIDGEEALIQAADRALYRAKEGGKNCCVLAS
jgi:diguanylate cyclase (GGDEF)-like protein